MTLSDSLRQFRAKAPRFDHSGDEQLERILKNERMLCVCGKPVAVLRKGTPCTQCKSCIAKRLVGDLDSL